MKNTKHALILSAFSLLLCVSMLVGSTYAWFNDSVSVTNNKIVAGELKVQLLMNNGAGYADISSNAAPIFGEGSIAQNNNAQTLWEPGKTQVAYLAIHNAGNLSLKYNTAMKVYGVEKNLNNVLKYSVTPEAQYGSVTAWDATKAKPVAVGNQELTEGEGLLEPNETHYFALSIHMDLDAANDYQGGEISFDLTVVAAQLNNEEDSFGNSYDISAEYDVPSTTPPTVNVFSAADLKAALSPAVSSDSAVIVLANDITLAAGENWVPLDLQPYSNTVKNIVINGNGHSISGLNAPLIGGAIFGNTSVEIHDLTLKNVMIADYANTNDLGVGAFIAYADNSAKVLFENCHLIDSSITATTDFSGIGGLIGYSSSDLEIVDCSVTNTVVQGQLNSAGAIAGHVSAGENTTISNAKVVGCNVKGERQDKSGFVVGTANNGATVITTHADCGNNTVFDVAASATIYGRLVGGTITVNGVTLP